MLFHAGVEAFSGGFVGVDVFFVISGYLITGIILRDVQRGAFSLGSFYERRARRILPALFVVSLVSMPLAWYFMTPHDLRSYGKSLVGVATFSSNFFFWKESGYFGSASELKPLLHTWSLAVEEQYYLLFPLVLLALLRHRPSGVMPVLAAAGASSFFLTWHWLPVHPETVFYLLPTRAWELLVGAMAATWSAGSDDGRLSACPRPLKQAIGVTGLVLIVLPIALYDAGTPFPGLHALPPVVGAALLLVSSDASQGVGRLLAMRPLVFIGLISYSAYLWHQPLLALAKYELEETAQARVLLPLVALSLLLAYLSWRFVEQPFRFSGRVQTCLLAVLSVGGLSTLLVAGAVLYVSKGFEAHYLEHRLNDREQDAYRRVQQHTGRDMYRAMQDDGECRFWAKEIDAAFVARFDGCSRRWGAGVVVLGDSHAMNVHNALVLSRHAPFMVTLARGGCRPHGGREGCSYDAFLTFAAQRANAIRDIVFHQSGAYLLKDGSGRVDRPDLFQHPERLQIHYENLSAVVGYLQRLARTNAVVWLGPFAEARVEFRDLRRLAREGFQIGPATLDAFRRVDRAARGVVARGSIPYVSLTDAMDLASGDLLSGECLVFQDADHLSACGEALYGPKISAALSSVGSIRRLTEAGDR